MDMYNERTPTEDEPVKESVPRRKFTFSSRSSPVPPTISSTASTGMWDELEGIKRRLRQLELNHPSTTNGERPQTRGTTNSSSSPQRSSPFPSHTGTSITSTSSPASYPLLNAAITKVKASGLSIDIAHAIEATAQEAVSLAILTSNQDATVQPPSPRTIRKRVDGICRGLAEVCLALADHQQLTQRQQTRAAQHRAEDVQDSSPLSSTGRQSMTLSRHTAARRLTNGTTTSRTASTVSRPRRTAQSVVGGEDFGEDDNGSIVSRPVLSRYNTIPYRPPSRAATEIYRDSPPQADNLQRFTTRRSLLSRHGATMSEFNLPSQKPPEEDPPMPRTATRSTFTSPGTSDPRRRSLQTYFSSPPRQGDYLPQSGIPTPQRPMSFISPPRVNVANSATSSSGDRTTGTVRRRQTGVPEKYVATEEDEEEVRSTTTLSRSNTNPNRRTLDLRRHESIQRRYARQRDDEPQ
jgi:hypothetical protein